MVLLPPTPLHFLAIAPLNFKLPEKFDITSLLVSSTFVDLEIVYFFLIGEPTYHGLWHSYIFVLTIYPVVLSLIVYGSERMLGQTILRIYGFFRFYPKKVTYSLGTIYLCCLIGGVSHIFFDMWVHRVSSYVFFPFFVFSSENPFWIGEYEIVGHICVGLLGLYTIYLWIKNMPRMKTV